MVITALRHVQISPNDVINEGRETSDRDLHTQWLAKKGIALVTAIVNNVASSLRPSD